MALLPGLLGVTVPFGQSAVFTTSLQPHTVASWDDYIARFESGRSSSAALLNTDDDLIVQDRNPLGGNAGNDVPDGFIHNWIGAVRIPGATVADVRAVLEDYPHYAEIYAPDVITASGSKTSPASAALTRYDVRIVSQRKENFGIRFAFDMHSRVEYRVKGPDTLVDSRSYSIRESDSGKAPFTDLLPEGEDHGIAWRLNSYWRLRQVGDSVYAECQVISLSRKPLPGMRDQIKSRARASLTATLRATARAAQSKRV